MIFRDIDRQSAERMLDILLAEREFLISQGIDPSGELESGIINLEEQLKQYP